MKSFILKKPGLKLIRVSLEESGGMIDKIRITGDFFMHPEESIEGLEEMLSGQEISEDLVRIMQDFFRKNSVQLFGITAEAVYEAIEGCR